MAHALPAHAQDLRDASRIYRFHGFNLDAARWELCDPRGARVAIAPLPFRLLLLLIEQRTRVVSQDELLTTLWHEVVVRESSLTQAIRMVRRALGGGEDATRWVQTIRGRGYRFATSTEEISFSSLPEQAAPQPRRSRGIASVVRRPVDATIDRRLRLAQLRWALTSRQLDVLRGLVNGLGNRELAQTLQCSLRTIETHMTALLERCDAPSRLSLVAAFWTDL
jgi:DNA-binding winged helix-turn-helix (wHTH) protein